MCEMKTLPLDQLIKYIYPDFYNLDCLINQQQKNEDQEEIAVPVPPRLQLSAEQ